MFNFQALVQRGLAAMEQRRYAEAEQTWRTLLEANPRDDQLLHLLGVALIEQQREAEALEPLQRAISLQRRRADYHNALGCALRNVGRLEESLESFRRSLKLDPTLGDTHYNLALTHQRMGKFDEAEAAFLRLIARDPGDREAITGRADLRWLLADHAGAVRILREGIQANPDAGDLRFTLADRLLALGEFEEGWFCYLWRVNRNLFLKRTGLAFNDPRLVTPFPRDLSGQVVRIHAEQGLGDDLFFLRFAALLRERGARVEGAVTDRVMSLVGRSGVLDAMEAAPDRIPRGPEQRMLADLPFLLQAHEQPPPRSLRFAPLPEHALAIDGQLASLPRPLIGLTWRAGTAPTGGTGGALYKAVPFEKFAAMAAALPGTLVVLQRDPAEEELARLRELTDGRMADFSRLNADLEGMLALLDRLDDSVGVSNTNMHLLAALGRTARVLVSRGAEFRWMAEGEASPWFPGFKVYRQSPGGDWSPALGAVGSDLAAAFAR